MSRRLTRRKFLRHAAVLGAAIATPGLIVDAIAQTTRTKPRTTRVRGTRTTGKLPLTPLLKFGSPGYAPRLMPIRVLKEWRPSNRDFLLHQHDHMGSPEQGSYFVATLRNEGEGAAFDAVVEIFALVIAVDRRARPLDVVKFNRVSQVVGDVQANHFSDFAMRIDWSNAQAFAIREADLPRGAEGYSSRYVARYWHPIFDPPPAEYVERDPHFLAAMGGSTTWLRPRR